MSTESESETRSTLISKPSSVGPSAAEPDDELPDEPDAPSEVKSTRSDVKGDCICFISAFRITFAVKAFEIVKKDSRNSLKIQNLVKLKYFVGKKMKLTEENGVNDPKLDQTLYYFSYKLVQYFALLLL